MPNRSKSNPVIPLTTQKMPKDQGEMAKTPQGEEVAREEGEETGTEVGAMAMTKRPISTLRTREEKATSTTVNPPAGTVARKSTCLSIVKSP